MSSNESRKSIWISGPYGTGKTFASFVIKHILENDIEDVKTYFEKQGISQTLFNRFVGLKQNWYSCSPSFIIFRYYWRQ